MLVDDVDRHRMRRAMKAGGWWGGCFRGLTIPIKGSRPFWQAITHDDAREAFASGGYATIVESGFIVSGLVVADRSRTRNQIIDAGAIAHTRTVGQVDAGQFIAARAAGDPFDETTTITSGIATASNPSRPIIAGNG